MVAEPQVVVYSVTKFNYCNGKLIMIITRGDFERNKSSDVTWCSLNYGPLISLSTKKPQGASQEEETRKKKN